MNLEFHERTLKIFNKLLSGLSDESKRGVTYVNFALEVSEWDCFLSYFNRQYKTVDNLLEQVKCLEGALIRCEKHCLCDRNTKGFDYGETHLALGKPGMGKRWLTPGNVASEALKQLAKLRGEV